MSLGPETFNEFARELCSVAIGEISPDRKCKLGVSAIISPISIHSALILTFMGTAGKTADQLRKALKLGPFDLQQIARSYYELWMQQSVSYGDRIKLKSVNRMFVNHNLTLQNDFRELCEEYFKYLPEAVDFSDASNAVKQINELVEEATEKKIHDLLDPDAVNACTSAVLVNALYFKGEFEKPFSPDFTMPDKFYINTKNSVEMPMMNQEDKFKYAELRELDARAVALPFADSDIHMLILLPNKLCGLPALERHLNKLNLSDIVSRMQWEDVEISMPKFGIEFDLDLIGALMQIGILEVFTDDANLSRLFEESDFQKISAAKHRGYIDVNEAGCEAVAATFLKIVPMSLNMGRKIFRVDHPFSFYIRNSKTVFFAGRFVAPVMESDTESVKCDCEFCV